MKISFDNPETKWGWTIKSKEDIVTALMGYGPFANVDAGHISEVRDRISEVIEKAARDRQQYADIEDLAQTILNGGYTVTISLHEYYLLTHPDATFDYEHQPMKREEVLEQYQKAFAVINHRLFNDELPPIMIDYITKDPEGWHECTACFRGYEDGRKPPFIVLQCGSDSEPMEGMTLDTINDLCHELIHYYCYLHGIEDIDWEKAPQYHNLDFKKIAEDHGATCSQDEERGYCIAKWSEEELEKLFDEIENGIPAEQIETATETR